jgi:hypothetical protein
MAVIRVLLRREPDKKSEKNRIGFEIQGLQYSEAFHKNCIKDIVIQTINSNQQRGGHSHKLKTEWFIALQGEAELTWSEKTVSKKDELITMPLIADFENPYILEVQPKTCHWIRNKSEKVFTMASFSTVQFDEKNPDMEKCEKE